MSSDVVKDHWMVIGTQNKLINFKSNIKDRIKSGAKGIGRFALDRLGEQCEMISFTKRNIFKLLNGLLIGMSLMVKAKKLKMFQQY